MVVFSTTNEQTNTLLTTDRFLTTTENSLSDASELKSVNSSTDTSTKKEGLVSDVLFGSIAGFAGKIVEFPFDTIKVRLQTQPISSTSSKSSSSSTKKKSKASSTTASPKPNNASSSSTAPPTSLSPANANKAHRESLRSFRSSSSAAASAATPIPLFSGPFDCLKKTVHHEGLSGLYKGLSSPLIGSMLENAVLFVAYNHIQDVIRYYSNPVERELQLGKKNGSDDLSVKQLAIAGAASGAFVSFVLTPVELIKCKLQVKDVDVIYGNKARATQPMPSLASTVSSSSPSVSTVSAVAASQPIHHYQQQQTLRPLSHASASFKSQFSQRVSSLPKTSLSSLRVTNSLNSSVALPTPPTSSTGPMDIFIQTIRNQGIRGLYRGHVGTFLRETSGGAAWFGVYELMCRSWVESKGLESKKDLSPGYLMAAGSMAGMAYNAALFPADVIKSRQQTEEFTAPSSSSSAKRVGGGGFWEVGKELWKAQGLKGFYRGFGITLARSIPSSAVIFLTYESLNRNYSF